MSDISDALARLAGYNGNPYDTVFNPRGLSGKGGMPANLPPALRDVGTVGAYIQSTYQLIQSVAGSGLSLPGGLNATPIGNATPSTGAFTVLRTTGNVISGSAVVISADAGANGVIVNGRNDGIGSIVFNNQAGSTTQAYIQSWGDRFIIGVLGAERARFWGSTWSFSATCVPFADNAYSLGLPSLRWKDIYAANAVIQTSDARTKTDVVDCPLGLDFILALRPVRYRFKDIDIPAVTTRRTVERPVVKTMTQTREEVRLVDGQHRLVTVTETVEEPVLRPVPLFDADGRPLLDETGAQRLHQVPVSETVEEEVVEQAAVHVVHRRPHDGLIAQEVKAVLDQIGTDAGAYIHDASSDGHGLRYSEFIAPLIRAVQELAAEVADLRAQIRS